jgi:hypothetical protein
LSATEALFALQRLSTLSDKTNAPLRPPVIAGPSTALSRSDFPAHFAWHLPPLLFSKHCYLDRSDIANI